MAKRERAVFLLRAVNLGPTNKVPMARLREVVADLGATEVSTYIASGNVLCRPPGAVGAFARQIEDAIKREFGVTTSAIPRTQAELEAARGAFPYDIHAPKFCAIWFLDQTPTAKAADAMAALDLSPDRGAVIGAEFHVRYEEGAGRSKLTAGQVERTLGVKATARNLSTVETLAELLGKAPG